MVDPTFFSLPFMLRLLVSVSILISSIDVALAQFNQQSRNDLDDFFYRIRETERCDDMVRCMMSEWDYMTQYSSELQSTSQSLHWVVEPPAEWWINPGNTNENYTVVLDCRARSYNFDSLTYYRWQRNDIDIDLYSVSGRRLAMTSGALTITRPTTADAGVYRCFASNDFGTIVSRESRLRSARTPLPRNRLTVAQRRKQLKTGSSQRLTCEGESNPPSGSPGLEFFWKRKFTNENGIQLTKWVESNSRVFVEANTGTLNFVRPEPEDAGEYWCVFRNTAEPEQMDRGFDFVETASFDVSFVGAFPGNQALTIIGQSFTDSLVVEKGDNVTMDCPVSAGSTQRYSFFWTVPEALDRAPLYLNGGMTLFFAYADADLNGDFVCRVEGETWEPEFAEKRFKVFVYSTPFIEQPLPKVISARYGQDLKASCGMGGEPAPSIRWYKDGQELSTESNVNTEGNSIEFRQANTFLMAMYQCEAYNEHGTAVSESTVRILEMEPLFQYQFEPAVDILISAGQGQTARLPCKPFTFSQPVMTWKFRNQILRNSSTHTIQMDGTLVIKSTQQDDAGQYTCVAESSSNSADNVYTLRVLPPLSLETPADTVVVLQNRTVDLKCRLRLDPEEDGIYVWEQDGRVLDPVPAREYHNTETFLRRLDKVFGSDDIYYRMKDMTSFERYAPPPFFYPDNVPDENPWYPAGGDFSRVFSRNKRSTWDAFAMDRQYSSQEVLARSELWDPFDPYKSKEQYQQEIREEEFVIMKYHNVEIPWQVGTLDNPRLHYIRVSDSRMVGDLRIYRAQPFQGGDYKCCFHSAVSKTCNNLKLEVISVPGKPANVEMTKSNRLRWGIPSDGGSPITGFIIEALIRPSGEMSRESYIRQQTIQPGDLGDVPDMYDYVPKFEYLTDVIGSTSFVELGTLLKPYCDYTFRVIAVNDVGRGLPSAPSSPLVSTPQDRPRVRVENITAYFGRHGELSMQWSPLKPTDFGSPTEMEYLITYWPSSGGSSFVGGQRQTVSLKQHPFATRLTVPVSALPPAVLETQITFAVTVQVRNRYGAGPVSETAYITSLPRPPTEPVRNVRVLGNDGTSLKVVFLGINLELEPTFQGYIVEFWRYDRDDMDEQLRDYELTPGNRTRFREEEMFIFELQPSMNYRVVVYPYNLAGRGPGSNIVSGSTVHAPPSRAPQNVEVFSYSSSAIRVRWSPIELQSGEVQLDGYLIFYWMYGTRANESELYDWRRREHDETEIILYGLKSGERYIVVVQAYNLGGHGPRSEPVNFLMRYTEFNSLWRDSSPVTRASGSLLALCAFIRAIHVL